MADKAPTVTVTALKYHTHKGEAYDKDATYDADAADVPNLVAQGMVSAPEAPAAPAKPSQPVEPMTTTNTGIVPAVEPLAPAKVKPVAAKPKLTKPAGKKR